MAESPYAYFVTFTCFGARLHGNSRGYVGRNNNTFDTPHPVKDKKLYLFCKEKMKHGAYELDECKRKIALKSIVETCEYCNWNLLAAHVRSNHIHVVISSEVQPEIIMSKLKTYISRKLNEQYPREKTCKKWTRHGSTKHLWGRRMTEAVIAYVLHDQGRKMAVYEQGELKTGK